MGRRIGTRGAFVVAALVVGVGGCGGGDDASTTPADDDAGTEAAAADVTAGNGDEAPGCELVSPDEVEAATGFTVLGQEEQYGGCRWTIEQVDEDVLESAISWQPFDGAQIDGQRAAGDAGMDVEDLADIGDEAIVVSQSAGDHPLGEVWVRVGDTSFRITNEFSTARYAESLEKQAALAAVVAETLQ